jgi:hypothetical protein
MPEPSFPLTRSRIQENILAYIEGQGDSPSRTPTARYASFDYCYNYFQTFREQGELPLLASPDRMEQSCLQLGFYLASWGMFRGSSALLQHSSKRLEPLISALATTPQPLWEIDANSYTDDRIHALLEHSSSLRRLIPGGASDTLITKVLLGVFGSVPAFDSFFKRGLGAATFGPKALRSVSQFYSAFADLIENNRVPTLDFNTGLPTTRLYTRAKVIDMIFFIEGSRLS